MSKKFFVKTSTSFKIVEVKKKWLFAFFVTNLVNNTEEF
jgi:hypothetical protein